MKIAFETTQPRAGVLFQSDRMQYGKVKVEVGDIGAPKKDNSLCFRGHNSESSNIGRPLARIGASNGRQV